jgi:hypothetical protein
MDTEGATFIGYVCSVVLRLCAAIWCEFGVAFQILEYGYLSRCS